MPKDESRATRPGGSSRLAKLLLPDRENLPTHQSAGFRPGKHWDSRNDCLRGRLHRLKVIRQRKIGNRQVAQVLVEAVSERLNKICKTWYFCLLERAAGSCQLQPAGRTRARMSRRR